MYHVAKSVCFFGLWIAVEQSFPTRRELKGGHLDERPALVGVEQSFPTRRELKGPTACARRGKS